VKKYFFKSQVKKVLSAKTVEKFFIPILENLQDEIIDCQDPVSQGTIKFAGYKEMIKCLREHKDWRMIILQSDYSNYIMVDKKEFEIIDDTRRQT
jgi:hypothetical protein